MLATATSNCAVTNVAYNENKHYVVTVCLSRELFISSPRCTCADAGDYVIRSLLCATLRVGSVVVQC